MTTIFLHAARPAVAVVLFLAVVARAGDANTVPEVYEMHDISAPEAAEEIGRCAGMSERVAQDFVADEPARASAGQYGELTEPGSPGAALAVNSKWACIRMSQQGFPLWPVETLRGLIVADGAAPQAVAAWRRKLLERVARDGVAHGLVVYPQGTATEVDIFADKGHASYVSYGTAFHKKGDYDPARFAAVLADPHLVGLTLARVSNGRERPNAFAIPGDRLRKPLDGEYVRRAGDPATAAFAFEDTHWQLKGSTFLLDLLPGGGVKGGGSWHVDGGVLHVALESGSRLSLSVEPDGRRLHGDSRRPIESHDPEGDGEFRGAPVYERR